MKEELDRTKVVLRHLPPAITRDALVQHVDHGFAGRYEWLTFRPGKSGHKHHSYSRAYIEFKKPEDVMEFAEFFNGHVFVNEKGTHFKTIVEYAPSQRVPNKCSKKDAREGTILNDPEYMEFLDSLAKPVGNLPSAEIQLERREAERAGAAKDVPIVTPLMDFVRQKRAAKIVGRRGSSNGKPGRRAIGSSGSANSIPKRRSDKKSTAIPMYVLRDSNKSKSGKDKTPQLPEVSQDESGSAITDVGKRKILLLKGKDKEISHFSRSMSQQQNVVTPIKNIVSDTKQGQQHESSGRMIRGILMNKNARQGHIPSVNCEHQMQILNLEKDKRPPRPSHLKLVVKDSNGLSGDRVGNNIHNSEKHEKRTRARDRPDRGIWTFRRSEGLHASNESLSSSASQASQSLVDSSEAYEIVRSRGDAQTDVANIRVGNVRTMRSGRDSHSLDNGSYRHFRRGPHGLKDVDGPREGKPLKRVGSREKQVWVQKSSTG